MKNIFEMKSYRLKRIVLKFEMSNQLNKYFNTNKAQFYVIATQKVENRIREKIFTKITSYGIF